MNQKILVTRAYTPPLAEYVKLLRKIWKSRWFTNEGIFVEKLEKELAKKLDVKHVFFVSNGTIALQLAIKALGLKKEIITTPFSFPATTNAILWEGNKPVYVDIDKTSYCIDAEKIEEAITPETKAILAVHVYGNPCEVEKIERIAKKHNLKVIYDAAHAFAVKVNGKSIFRYGDISTISFHATKVFHTGEGGAVITNDDVLARKIEEYRNFGFWDDDYISAGINAKNSEIHAALGLLNLKKVDSLIKKRKIITSLYDSTLSFYGIQKPEKNKLTTHNYGYYPVLFKSEDLLLKVIKKLNENNIYPRRYFYPSLNKLPYVTGFPCPVSESISERVLCLPLYPDLEKKIVLKISKIINEVTLNHYADMETVSEKTSSTNQAKNIVKMLTSFLRFQKKGSFAK